MNSLVEKQIGNELMIYDTESDSVHIMNPSAQLILEMLRKGSNKEEIIAAIKGQFEVPSTMMIDNEIVKTIDSLEILGVV